MRAIRAIIRRRALVPGRRAGALHMRSAWLPLALRWKRRRPRVQHEQGRAAAASVNTTWHSHIHLHFGLRAQGQLSRVGRTSVQGSATASDAARPSAEGQRATTRSTQPASPPLQPARAPRMSFARSPVADRRVSGLLRPTRSSSSSSRIAPLTTPSIERRAHPQRHARVRVGMRTAHTSAERAVAPLAPRHFGDIRPQLSGSCALIYRHPARPIVPDIATSWAEPGRRTELVWRSAPQSSTRSSNEAPPRGETMPAHPAVADSVTKDLAARAVSPSTQRASLEVTHLAPSLVDRLTDDVIRRVERRIRIDRERRGL
jgi:hypothetical protein